MEDNKNIIEQLQEKIEKLESEMDNIKSVLEIQDEDEFDYDSDEDDLQDYEKEDLAHLDAYLSAIETLLKYYTYIGDAEEFLSSTKAVYNKE